MRIHFNSSDLKFISTNAARLKGLPIRIGDNEDDTGCRIGTFLHARVYLCDKIGEDEGGGDLFDRIEVRGRIVPQLLAEQLAEAVELWGLAVEAVDGHVEATGGSFWACDREDVEAEILGGNEGWSGLRDDGADPTPTEWDLIVHAAEIAWDEARAAGIASVCTVEADGFGAFEILAPAGSEWAVRESLPKGLRVTRVRDAHDREDVDFDPEIFVSVLVDADRWIGAHPTLKLGDRVSVEDLLEAAEAGSWQALEVVAEAIAEAVNDLAAPIDEDDDNGEDDTLTANVNASGWFVRDTSNACWWPNDPIPGDAVDGEAEVLRRCKESPTEGTWRS